MNLLTAIVVGALFAGGTYLMLRSNIQRVALGIALLSHGANLLIISVARYHDDMRPPIISDPQLKYTDPLPQALILTAIVIGFGVIAFFLTFVYRCYKETGTDQIDKLAEAKNE